MTRPPPHIWQLTEDDVETAGSLLARAFADEPLHCHALPGVAPHERAETLWPYFVVVLRFACQCGEAWAVGREPGEIAGVGWWFPFPEAEDLDEQLTEAGWKALPAETLRAFDRVLAAEGPVQEVLAGILPRRHRHLAQLGVEPSLHGQGLGRALLAKLLADAAAVPVPLCLWTATPGNVPFYQRAGMELIAEGAAADGRPAWWALATPMTPPAAS